MASLQLRLPPSRPFSANPSSHNPIRSKCFKSLATSPNSDLSLGGEDNLDIPDPVKLAFARAEAYKRQKLQSQSNKLEGSFSDNGGKSPVLENPSSSGQANQGSKVLQDSAPKGRPPEVEIIVGDPTKFGNPRRRVEEPEKNGETETYRPKVKTWGVFPRPLNISKTYGGGKVIRPGDVLETKEDKEAKEKSTKELITAYKSQRGLIIDPKLLAECQKSLKEGNDLMDQGRLRQALPFYERVMKGMIFESELHGRAALQWSICLDSLQRSSEAKVMYEKLENHPNSEVSTKARHFAFSFKAMEFMKVKSTYISRTTGYEMYFDSFVDNKEVYTSAKAEPKEAGVDQILPYVVFLASPLLVVLWIAVRESFLL